MNLSCFSLHSLHSFDWAQRKKKKHYWWCGLLQQLVNEWINIEQCLNEENGIFLGYFFNLNSNFLYRCSPSHHHTHTKIVVVEIDHITHTKKHSLIFFLRFCLFSPKLIGKTLCLWIINFFFSGEKKCFDIHFIFIETMPRKTRKPENKFSPFYYYYYWAFILAGRHQNDDDRKKNLIIEKSKWKMKNEKHRI